MEREPKFTTPSDNPESVEKGGEKVLNNNIKWIYNEMEVVL